MSTAERNEANISTAPHASGVLLEPGDGFRAWLSRRMVARFAAEIVPAAAPAEGALCSLDQPGHNCQVRETPSELRDSDTDPERDGQILARHRDEAAWWSELEAVWWSKREPEVARWKARAESLRAERAATPVPRMVVRADGREVSILDVRERYATARASSQAMPRQARKGICRRRWVAFGCGCGSIARPVGCDVTLLCGWCRARHLKRWRRRITKALRAHQEARHARWRGAGRPRGGEPLVYMLTLTVAHSGDVARDREELWRGWRALSKWLREAVGGAPPYAAAWEVTAGRDDLGHVHCHVVTSLPWFSWEDANAAWRRACPRSKNIDFKCKDRNGRPLKAERAADYLAKYVTKGAEVSDMPGALAGAVLASWYGKRKVSCSRHFWRPLAQRGKACCRRCGDAWRVTERPRRMLGTSPEAVWFALVRMHPVPSGGGGASQLDLGFDVPRGVATPP